MSLETSVALLQKAGATAAQVALASFHIVGYTDDRPARVQWVGRV